MSDFLLRIRLVRLLILGLTLLPFAGSGVVAQIDGTWTVLDRANSDLGDDFIMAYLDAGNARLIGTFHAGLYRSDGGEWQRVGNGQEIPNDTITSLVAGLGEEVWVGTHGGGIVRMADNTFTTYSTQNTPLRSDNISANGVGVDLSSRLWVGTWGGGVTVRNAAGEWITYDTSNSDLPDDIVWSFAVDSSDAVWLGTLNGVARVDGDVWSILDTTNSEIPLQDIASILVEPSGCIWFGTWGEGVARMCEGEWTSYSVESGHLRGDLIEALEIDHVGRLWIGTWGGGVTVLDGEVATQIDSASTPLPSDRIRQISFDPEERIMHIATVGGLASLKLKTSSVVDHRRRRGTAAHEKADLE